MQHHFSVFIVVSFRLCLRHRSKWSQVVKDKHSALHNATTTDSVVPEGEKAVHSNCMAHTHIYVHKIGAVTGTLSNKEALPYAKKWLKSLAIQHRPNVWHGIQH